MATILAILNSIGRSAKAIKTLLKNGLTTGQIFSNPRIISRLMFIKILGALIGFGKGVIASALVFVLIIGIILGGVVAVFEMFKTAGYTITQSFKSDITEWANNLSEDDMKIIEEGGYPLNPKKIPDYIAIEDESYPKNINLQMKEKTIKTRENNYVQTSQKTSDRDVPYTLDLEKAAYPYRLWWQFVLGMDVTTNTKAEHWWEKSLINKIRDQLKPDFSWAYDKYSKDITNSTQEHYLLYQDGALAKQEMNQTDVTEFHPLPYLNSVSTITHEYSFVIEENIETINTGWSSPQDYESQSWTVHHTDKDGNITSSTHYTEIRYKKSKQVVIEDILQEEVETVNTSKLQAFLDAENIHAENMGLALEIAKNIPQSGDFIEKFSSALDDMKFQFLLGQGYIDNISLTASDFIEGIPFFHQADMRWGNLKYGTGTMKSSACGPTAFAMVATGISPLLGSLDINKDSILDPYESALYSIKNGYRIKNAGTAWSFFAGISKEIGLTVTQYGKSEYQDVIDKLQIGVPVIASMGVGHFTSGGHYIVIVGIDSEGKFIIQDPLYVNNEKYQLNRWASRGISSGPVTALDFCKKRAKPNIVLTEAKQYWTFEK